MDNKIANMHLLTPAESIFFMHKVQEVNDKLIKITQEQELTGEWTLSSDFKWLIKVRD